MEINKNDLIICAPERDNDSNKVFDIYARVIDVSDGIIALDRYQKFGALRCRVATYNMSTIEEYYRPMTDEEKRNFADTMYGRKVDIAYGEINLGGDSWHGWEEINGTVFDTLVALSEFRNPDKESLVWSVIQEKLANEKPVTKDEEEIERD